MNLKDPATFSRAYDEHSRAVYATAYRVLGDATLAQDVVQDVFMRVWRRPESFDARRGSIGTYLRLMARSRAVDVWREHQAAGRATDRLKAEAMVIELRPAAPIPSAEAERTDEAATVRAALAGLPEPQREALVLAYWGGLTAEQIAAKVGIPLGTAKSRLRLALGKLRLDTADVLAA
jgi:RNA polymerase sigma-70 factor (ECF subfamily)